MILSTNYVTWKGVYTHRNYISSLLQDFVIITCSFSVFVENCILLPKGITELNIVEILLQSALFSVTKM
jgi:hypothetical protein